MIDPDLDRLRRPLPACGPPPADRPPKRLYYRKEKLRGACWEYQVDGGWLEVTHPDRRCHVLHHRFSFYRPRPLEVRTRTGVQTMERAAAQQWFFPDRWFSLLRFVTDDDQTVGYYVNFSQPLRELRQNYYRDLDLELDLWLHPDGTTTELDRDEFNAEIATKRMEPAWADAVNDACTAIIQASGVAIAAHGPDLDSRRDPSSGLPEFILQV
ncbi:MAG: DUF402 domain-containing protein [Thermomicrobiales bacterium]